LEAAADKLYTDLQASGIEVFYDDREESPGVKFNDADLIGLPVRLTISERSLAQGGIELKIRSETEKRSIPIDSVPAAVRLTLEAMAPGYISHNPSEYERGC
jgi:prolyl-tRNA synthetase